MLITAWIVKTLIDWEIVSLSDLEEVKRNFKKIFKNSKLIKQIFKRKKKKSNYLDYLSDISDDLPIDIRVKEEKIPKWIKRVIPVFGIVFNKVKTRDQSDRVDDDLNVDSIVFELIREVEKRQKEEFDIEPEDFESFKDFEDL